MRSPALRYARLSFTPRYIPDSTCVVYFPGQDDPQSAVIRDRSGNGNDGAHTNVTWKRNSRGLWYPYYNGTNAVTTITHATSIIPATGTMMFWLNTAEIAEDVMGKGIDATHRFAIWLASSKMSIGIINGVAWSFILTPATQTFAADTWIHVVWVFGESGVGTTHYQDAVDVTNAATGDAADEIGLDVLTSEDLLLMESSAAAFKEGGMALFKMFNTALSQELVTYHRNLERHLFGV